MGTLQGIKALFASFTAFPIKSDQNTLAEAANYLPLVPLIGSVIGLLTATLVGVFRLIFPAIIAGILGLGFLLYINGLRHTSGLMEFGNGPMHKGSLKEKTMRNGNAGGFVLAFIVLASTALSIANLGALRYFQDIIVAETSARLAIVALAWIGKPASGENIPFVEKMHGSRRGPRITFSLAISLAIGVLVIGLGGLIVVLVGFLTPIILAWLASKSFGGVTGAAFWAANDISRMTCLLTILAIS